MKTIWKYTLNLGRTDIKIPKGATILCVQDQFDDPTIWALVDTNESLEDRVIEIYGTGHEIPAGREYIGTFQMEGGGYVFHALEAPTK